MNFTENKGLENHDMATNGEFTIDTNQLFMGSFQVQASAATGSQVIRGSNDGVNFVDLQNPPVITNGQVIEFPEFTMRYYKYIYTGGAAGSLNVIFFGKGA